MAVKGGGMVVNQHLSAATHFGRQLRKTRQAQGWSLDDLSRATGADTSQLSRVENGKRPPSEALALKCDEAFPERGGWFTDWYRESRTWSEVPARFKDWTEHEEGTGSLRVWQPSVIHGLLQTEAYARSLLSTSPGATADTVSERTASRMERQKRVIFRADPPEALFLVDELSLHRCVGSATAMAEQCQHLLDVASMPYVTLQVVPAVGHPGGASGLIVADTAAYAEHVAAGYVLEDHATFAAMTRLFDTLRCESYRASESTARIERMCESWATGESPLTATPTAATVSRSPRAT